MSHDRQIVSWGRLSWNKDDAHGEAWGAGSETLANLESFLRLTGEHTCAHTCIHRCFSIPIAFSCPWITVRSWIALWEGAERWVKLLVFVDTIQELVQALPPPMEQKQHSPAPFSHLHSYMKMHREPGWDKKHCKDCLQRLKLFPLPSCQENLH